jgi:hypothetical protein
MQQRNESNFIVDKDEIVTIEITANKIGDRAIYTLPPSANLQQVSQSPRTYRFTANIAPGKTLFGQITCDFVGAPDDASFEVKVSSPGSGSFDGPTIIKSDPGSGEPISLNFEGATAN